MNATNNLKQDNLIVRRLGEITQSVRKDSANAIIPFEDLDIVSVVIEEYVDRFHHGKEEQAYFPETKEDIRKFLIEHELGRRIARMFRRNLKAWKEHKVDSREPVVRFLKSYSVFITDHTGKEDIFFSLIQDKGSISNEEDVLIKHFQSCRNQLGGAARIEQMIKLIEYLEGREWMK